MSRRKRLIRWIANDVARKACFRKRQSGLIKKVKELSTLCDIPGMCVIYNPVEELSPSQPLQPSDPPTIWPSREVAVQLMERFLALPAVERTKKMTNQLGYLREVVMKAQEKQGQESKKIQDMEFALLMDEVRYGKGLEGLDMEQCKSLTWLIRFKIQEIRRRMEFLGATQQVEPHHGPLQGMNQIVTGTMDHPLQGRNHIVAGTMDHPIYIDEDGGSSSLLDGSEGSTVETELVPNKHDGMDVELNLGLGRK